MKKILTLTTMIHKSFFRSIVILTTSLFVTCKQPVDFLPPATQTGQNTIGCLINGKEYIPDGGKPFSGIRPVIGGLFNRYGPEIRIFFYTYSTTEQSIEVYLDDYLPGLHLLNTGDYKNNTVKGRKHYGQYSSSKGYFITSSKYTGWVNVSRIDTVSGIVSGTFEFTGADQNNNSVSITNGRFDLNARTQ